MASLPPDGPHRLMLSLIRRRPVDLLRTNLTFSLWPLVSDPVRAHQMLFSPEMPAERVAAYHRQMQDEALLGSLDSLFLDPVDPSRVATPIVVLGAQQDALVSAADVASAGKAYGVEPILIQRGAHDMMLDFGWRDAADAIIGEIVRRLPRRRDNAQSGAASRQERARFRERGKTGNDDDKQLRARIFG